MNIQISDKFTYTKLIKFTLPSILMMIITSVYGVVDGLFVSNFIGKEAFSSLNLIMPFIMIFNAFGFMIGTGGCALVARLLGEQQKKKANEVFSLLIYILIIGSIALAVIAITFIEPIAIMLGATPELLDDCITYGVIMLIGLPAFIMQVSFQPFVVVADRPNMGMTLSILSGVTNIVLDFLFIAVFQWGIAGAALATVSGQFIGGIIPLIYFASKKNNSTLRLVKFKWDAASLWQSCTNGASEMMTSISLSLVNMLYNLQLMKFIGADGVSAYGVIMYVSFIFVSSFIGYTVGSSPIISYNYGANDKAQLHSIFKKSIVLMVVSSIVLTIIAFIFARQLASIFVGYDENLLEMSTTALRLYSFSYLFGSINIFASAFFTALNNGKISASISFLRTLVFQSIMIMVLPNILDINGIWLAVVFAEAMGLFVSIALLRKNRKRYGY